MRRAFAALSALAISSGCAAPETAAKSDCALSEAEAAWLDDSIAAWRLTRDQMLRIADRAAPPTMVFFNEACVFRGEGEAPWNGTLYEDVVPLPDGGAMPPQVTSFASSYDNDTRVFFVMALPTIWQAGGVRSDELGLERLMTAVLVHEMTHTRQFDLLMPRIAAADGRYNLGDALTDDIVQDRMEGDAGYVAAYEAERDLLFRAAAASTDEEARALAGEALAMMQARRAQYFVGDHEMLLELEDLFLTMEGLAQWTAHAWLVHPEGGGLSPEAALAGLRRGGSKWSQDQGLALYLVIDRLLPDWSTKTFGPDAAMGRDLLALAAPSGVQ